MMNLKNWMGGWALVAFVLVSGTAYAADPGAIQLRAVAEKVVVEKAEDGSETTKLVAPDVVVPGDRIAYTISARNVSVGNVDGVVITDPIPAQMRFIEGSETRDVGTVLFSVDGGQIFGRADQLKVIGEDGEPRRAEGADFTHIRWVFDDPLSPAAERSVRFVASVE